MRKRTQPKRPICEKCGKEPAISFSYFGRRVENKTQEQQWFFTGMCTADSEMYYVELDRFFNSPASTVDWLAHLNSKGWIDWADFMSMIRRFRDATGGYDQL